MDKTVLREKIARRLFLAAITLLISAQFFPGAALKADLKLAPMGELEKITADWEIIRIGPQAWHEVSTCLPAPANIAGLVCLVVIVLSIVATPWFIRPLRQYPGIRWMFRAFFVGVMLWSIMWVKWGITGCEIPDYWTPVFSTGGCDKIRFDWGPLRLTREFREGAWWMIGGLMAHTFGLCVLPGRKMPSLEYKTASCCQDAVV